jgi:hypothetical protein
MKRSRHLCRNENRRELPIIYPDLWLDYKVATHPFFRGNCIPRRANSRFNPTALTPNFKAHKRTQLDRLYQKVLAPEFL